MLIKTLVIVENHAIKDRFFRLVLKSEEIASLSQPGQFLHIQVHPVIHPLLRRPFSIYRVKNDLIEILYEVVGEGTKILSLRPSGETVSVFGPLGNSFSKEPNKLNPILVGGGIGIAPLLFLAERLSQKKINLECVLGYKTAQDIVGDNDFKALNIKTYISTNDGTAGQKGYVTDVLNDILTKDHFVYTCGPISMLKAVSELCNQKSVPCEVSIHNFMGCGYGVCLGCVFPTQKGYKRVCKDGPIFDNKTLIFG